MRGTPLQRLLESIDSLSMAQIEHLSDALKAARAPRQAAATSFFTGAGGSSARILVLSIKSCVNRPLRDVATKNLPPYLPWTRLRTCPRLTRSEKICDLASMFPFIKPLFGALELPALIRAK